MTLYWFLLVVSTLALAGYSHDSVHSETAFLASAMIVIGWSLLIQLAGTTAKLMIRQGNPLTSVVISFEKQLDWLRWGGLLVGAICIVGFRMSMAVKLLPVVSSSMALQALLLMLPALTITAAAWVCEHRLGVHLGLVASSGSLRQWCRLFGEAFRAILESGGWILVPVLGILAATDLVNHWQWFDQAAAAGMLSVVSLIAVPVLLPSILCRLWKTRKPSSEEQIQIDRAVPDQIQRRLRIRVWDTGMRTSNALIAGFLPRMQTMLLSDRLLNTLSTAELSLVIAHEWAHLRRGHVWLRAFSLIPVWILAAVLNHRLAGWQGSELVINLIAILLTGLTLRWVAHLTEFDADRSACVQVKWWATDCTAHLDSVQLAELYSHTLQRITGNSSSTHKASWLHPSVEARCQRLVRWAQASQVLHEPAVNSVNQSFPADERRDRRTRGERTLAVSTLQP